MIIVQGYIEVNQTAQPMIHELARNVVVATRAEPGCILYAIGTDVERPCRFLLGELWESDEALTAHLASRHVDLFRTALRALPDVVVVATKYEARNARPVTSQSGGALRG